MRKISYNFLFVFGLLILFGLGTAVSANTKEETVKIPKNMSMVTVTTDEPMTVYIDGVEVGKTQGNQIKFNHVVTPGPHEVKIVGANAEKPFTQTYTYVKGVKNCICLKTIKKRVETPCPYNISVTGPNKVTEGDLITFAAFNSPAEGVTSSAPLNYVWKVSPSNARITSGLGTPSITVDTTGLGKQTVRAEVEVTDGYYDAQCRQRIPAITEIDKLPEPEPRPFEEFDTIVFKVFDDDKARLDNYMVGLQNRPDGYGYMIVYQGTGKKALSADKMSKRSLDYLVKVRGLDPSKITIIQGGPREQTMAVLYFIYPSGKIPVPSPR